MVHALLNRVLPRSPIDQSIDLHALVNNVLHFCLLIITVIMLCVGYFLSQNKYGRALKMDAMRNVFKKSKRLKKSEEIFLSSMDAEERVEKVLREEGWGDVYLRRRVPVARVGHNREIDVIAVGPVVLVIEVKNWQGCVWSNGPRWFQKAFKRGKTLEFEDVQEDNVEKATAVRRYLENARRVALPDVATRNEFVFQGTNVTREVKEQSGPEKAAPAPSTPLEQEEQAHIDNEEDEAALLAELHHEDGAVVDSPTPPNDEEEDASLFTRVHDSPSCTAKYESAMQARGTWYTDSRLHKRHGKCIIPIVVFTSPRVILDPATIKQKKYVFTMDTFRIFAREVLYGNLFTDAPNHIAVAHRSHRIRQWIMRHRALRQWVPNWLLFPSSTGRNADGTSDAGKEFTLDEDTRDKVCHAVDVLRTWDLVYLHNGRLITGDVVKLEVPSAPCSYERKHMLDIFLSWNSGYAGIVKTLLTNKAGTVEVALTTQKRLAKKKKEKKKRNAKGNVVFTLIPKQPKNIKASDHIEIKQAGSRSTTIFALADVKEIRLSHHLYDVENRIV